MLLTFVFISFNICIVIKTIKSKACDHLKESMKETLDDVKKTSMDVSKFIPIKTIRSKACNHLKELMKETLDDAKKTSMNVPFPILYADYNMSNVPITRKDQQIYCKWSKKMS